MKWFLNLKTASKVLIVFGVELALLLMVALYAYQSLTTAQQTQRDLYEIQFKNAVDLSIMTAHQNNVRGNLFKLMLLTDSAQQRAEREEIQSLASEVTEIMERLQDRNRANVEFLAMLEEWDSTRLEFAEVRETQLLPKFFAGDLQGALYLALGEQVERLRRMREVSDQLILDAENSSAQGLAAADAHISRSLRVFTGASLIAVVLTIAAIVLMNRIIARPLLQISAVAERVADRDLTVNVNGNGRLDEVGTLQSTFRAMVDNLRLVTRDVTEGIGILASSSSEIMTSSTEVATGATETASAITETTSTVEEVKQAASMASQRAKSVSDSSRRASEVARKGSDAMAETVDGMRGIRQQMSAIAESITQLSEQGQSIGAIIATVDDIAEQSNLLAVNASIEAARAGEQGKGFAIVAHEMRTLAEQSKEATKQVRQILNDIQRGVTQAGMATEQGNRAVETGIKRAEEGSKTIQALLDTVTESAQAAVQIAAASQQQTAGMDQVVVAMENIRDASEQNVAATRQVETSARDLGELGQRLKDLIAQYKV